MVRRLCVTVFVILTLTLPVWSQAPVPPVTTRDLVAALIDTLRDPDVEVRTYGAIALAAVGAEAVDPLVTTLADKNPSARAAAAYSLGVMGAPATPGIAALVKTLKDESTDVRRQAAQALGRILSAQKAPSGTLFQPVPRPPEPLPPPPMIPAPAGARR